MCEFDFARSLGERSLASGAAVARPSEWYCDNLYCNPQANTAKASIRTVMSARDLRRFELSTDSKLLCSALVSGGVWRKSVGPTYPIYPFIQYNGVPRLHLKSLWKAFIRVDECSYLNDPGRWAARQNKSTRCVHDCFSSSLCTSSHSFNVSGLLIA